MSIVTHSQITDMFVALSANLEGGIMDWPANIQDGILKALERKEAQENCKYEIIQSHCVLDFNDHPHAHLILRKSMRK